MKVCVQKAQPHTHKHTRARLGSPSLLLRFCDAVSSVCVCLCVVGVVSLVRPSTLERLRGRLMSPVMSCFPLLQPQKSLALTRTACAAHKHTQPKVQAYLPKPVLPSQTLAPGSSADLGSTTLRDFGLSARKEPNPTPPQTRLLAM